MKQINDFTLKKIDEMSGRELFCTERLREETFVTEQKITLPELDDQDLIAIQAYRLNDNQTNALATCRIFEEDGKWMLGRVAVSKAARGMYLGSKMVEAVQEYLREKGVAALYCHAQMRVEPFYAQLGYPEIGEPFEEAGIQHIMMKKDLN